MAAIVVSFGQEAPLPSSKVDCGVLVTDFMFGHPQTPPVIFDKPFSVPSMRIQAVDAKTRKPLVGNEIIVRYSWRWFQYPYQEHPLGVWSDAYDLVRCVTDEDGMIIVPEHEVVPSGWYKGKHLLGRKPSFRHLDVSVGTKKSIQHFEVSRNELEKMRQSQKSDVVLAVSQ
ncbi:MAG: hypothetical protein WKF34_05675 [Pyrinomonadaceae bacterium]